MFKGLSNLANLGPLMKQAQEMGEKMQQVNEELKLERVTGNAGAGLIEVEANGLGEVLAVRIDPTLIEKQDRELIEDLLPAAFNAVQQKAKGLHSDKMQAITGGIQLPGIDLSTLGNSITPPEGA